MHKFINYNNINIFNFYLFIMLFIIIVINLQLTYLLWSTNLHQQQEYYEHQYLIDLVS